MSNYVIEVEGDIIIKDKKQYAVNWMGRSLGGRPETVIDDYDYDKRRHSVKGNLVLGENKRAVPYATYYSRGDISIVGNGNFYGYGNCPSSAYAYYRDNINELRRKMNHQVPEEIRTSFYNGLFLECFSILELYLSDFILCLCFTYDYLLGKAKSYLISIDKKKKPGPFSDLKVRNFFSQTMVLHRFDNVESLFNALDIALPSTEDLKQNLHKRDNIVHRNAFSGIDGMRNTSANEEDVRKLIRICDDFVVGTQVNCSSINIPISLK